MPVKPIPHKQLPVDEDISLHRKGWVIQRIGWVLMLVFLLAAVLGFFGEGPLSKKQFHLGPIDVDYERFGRYEHEMELKFQSTGENIGSVSMPQDYVKNFKLSKIVPEPEKQIAASGYINYIFEGENHLIIFYMDPVQRKNVQGVLKVNAYSFLIKQTIYP